LVPEAAPAEGDDAPLRVGDREDDAAAEAIVVASPTLLERDEPAVGDLLARGAARSEVRGDRLPRVRGVADVKVLAGRRGDAARLEVVERLPALGALAELLLEELDRPRVYLVEPFLAPLGAPRLDRGVLDVGDGDA